MRTDQYRICANCTEFRSTDRYHGRCLRQTELINGRFGPQIINKRVRWNTDARNCANFSGTIG